MLENDVRALVCLYVCVGAFVLCNGVAVQRRAMPCVLRCGVSVQRPPSKLAKCSPQLPGQSLLWRAQVLARCVESAWLVFLRLR